MYLPTVLTRQYIIINNFEKSTFKLTKGTKQTIIKGISFYRACGDWYVLSSSLREVLKR